MTFFGCATPYAAPQTYLAKAVPSVQDVRPWLLPLLDTFPLLLRNVTEQLENHVGDENSSQIPALPGVRKGHVQHYNRRVLPLCGYAPLFQDLRAVPSQPVNALDYQPISGTQFFTNI